ncbi:hypothetical protein [Echinococcus multilocularis]|uniref:Uncharacterized protein n=1 Tax=Echinococcus multilocularis TaxID=6211 RepID=A0A0S4MLI5_ECHMU|nr:hypothetical protein [Echinococcus multilocularis]
MTARCRSDAPEPSIFRASQFGRLLHTPQRMPTSMSTDLLSVLTNTFCGISWASALGTLTGRSVHPTAPVLLTKNGPLGTRTFNAQLHLQQYTRMKRVGNLTHLKFENRLSSFRAQHL